jgi:hypothetical protein
MSRRLPRFVLAGKQLIPGGFSLDDPRLSGIDIAVELRGVGEVIPSTNVRKLVNNAGKVFIDAYSNKHRLLIDLLIMGADKVTIDYMAPKKEIELAFAYSPHVALRMTIPGSGSPIPFWIADSLLPRLKELHGIGLRDIWIMSITKGKMTAFWKALPTAEKKYWRWWMAPDEGREVELLKDPDMPYAWLLSGDELL